MSNIFTAFLNTQPTDNHVLWGLLLFLNSIDDSKDYGLNSPIGAIPEEDLILAVCLLEDILGLDVPDEFITENKDKSIKQLASEIRTLEKLPDDVYAERLKRSQMMWKTWSNRN
ncbi:MAG: hypothetical protein ACYC09_11205 [Bacteroidota bacterium]